MEIMALDKIVDKWNRRVAIAGPEYEDGVRNPKRDWETETKAANDNYKVAIAEAIARDAFLKGVDRAGTAKWQSKTIELGIPRWPTGVMAATEDYRNGFAPFHAGLERLVLPQRRARGDERNWERSKKVGQMLHDLAMKIRGR